MGQQSSSNVQEFVRNSLSKFIGDVTANNGIWDEINNMTYDDFKEKLDEFNTLSEKTMDSTGKRLVFYVRKGTNKTLFWKATIQIACLKLDPETSKVHNYGLFNLKEFLQIFETLKKEYAIAEESKEHDLRVSQLMERELSAATDSSSKETNECCICFERKPDISLPCAHAYCMQCIEEWNEDHDTCPICRDHLETTDDSWVLSEAPKSEEICEDIRQTLMAMAQSHKVVTS